MLPAPSNKFSVIWPLQGIYQTLICFNKNAFRNSLFPFQTMVKNWVQNFLMLFLNKIKNVDLSIIATWHGNRLDLCFYHIKIIYNEWIKLFRASFTSYSFWRGSEMSLIPKLEIVIRRCKERFREKFYGKIKQKHEGWDIFKQRFKQYSKQLILHFMFHNFRIHLITSWCSKNISFPLPGKYTAKPKKNTAYCCFFLFSSSLVCRGLNLPTLAVLNQWQ